MLEKPYKPAYSLVLMGMFKNMLGSEESLFLDPVPLDYDYVPKLVPYREQEQRQIALCIKPLLAGRNGRNLLLHGPPGVGKTVAVRHLIKELEEEAEDIIPIYINCWQKNTSYKIILELCNTLDYRFTQNKKTDELFTVVRQILNKKSAVLVFDEVDKLEDVDFIYFLLEELYRKSIILITNYREWLVDLDSRIKSRLTAELLEFRQYNSHETEGILRERMKYAFVSGIWEEPAFQEIVMRAVSLGDIRTGLYLMREAGQAAEDKASKKITSEFVGAALQKLEAFSIKKQDELEEESRFILSLVKGKTDVRIGDLFREYEQNGGKLVYKSFQRKINKLAENRFISVKKVMGGSEGSTTLISSMGNIKKLTEF